MGEAMVIKNKSTTAVIASKVYGGFALLVNFVCLLVYITGIASPFGNMVTVVESIEMLFGILSMSGAYYRGIFGALIGATHIFFLVIMIKNFVVCLSSLKNILSEKYLSIGFKNVIISFSRSASQNLYLAILFAFICVAVNDYVFPKTFYLVAALCVVHYMSARVVRSINESHSIETILIKVGYDFLAIIAFSLMLLLTKYPVIENIIFQIRGLTINTKHSLLAMVSPILYCALMILALCGLEDITVDYHVLQNYYIADRAKKLFYVSIAISVASIVVAVLNGYTSRLNIDNILLMLKPYISILCVSGATIIVTMLPNDYVEKVNPDSQNGHLYTIDENGVLKIRGGVREIGPYAFCDRTDITEVFIPSSVNIIGDKAFSGCTKITKIHHPNAFIPYEWSPKWQEGCNCTLVMDTVEEKTL